MFDDHIKKIVDPVVWIDRLLYVNDTSQFSEEHKAIINKALLDLLKKVE